MFKLIVKKEFSSAHVLHGHPGDCKRMHGHNWLVEAKVEGNKINTIGMVIDFKDIKSNLQRIISKLDHQYLNDIEPFNTENPTAENISVVIYDKLRKHLPNNLDLKITLYETPRNFVSYSG